MRADAERNRERILRAARDLVSEAGPEASMEAIAARAGVAVGTLYRHHPTKAALLAAVVTDSAEQLAAEADAAVAEADAGADPGAVLADLVRSSADHYAADRAIKAASAALGHPVPLDPSGYAEGSPEWRAASAVEALLRRARGAGAVRADVTLDDLVLLLGALPGPEVGAPGRARYVELVLAGLMGG